MGLAVADYDGDGRLDVTKTNFTGDYPNLYRNAGGGIFEDISIKAGLGVNPIYVLWGTALEDFDNDGFRDLFQVTGHVYPEVQSIDRRESYKTPRLLYRNLGNGRFEDVSELAGPGLADARSSRGAAFGDFDNDGDLDVLVMNMHEAPSLLRNDLTRPGRWVKIQLRGVKSNRSAIGATVRVEINGRKQAAAVLSQSSFLSVNDSRLHFGLGEAGETGPVEVVWPSGLREEFPPLRAGTLYLLEEGTGLAQALPLPK